MTATVVSINPVDEIVRNIPVMLRALADRIEQGTLDYAPEQMVILPEAGNRVQPPILFGLPARHYEVVGILADAQMRAALEVDDE